MWYTTYRFPITLATEPLSFKDEHFEEKLIRTKIYDHCDQLIETIHGHSGKFWVTSEESGYGKSTILNYITRSLLKRLDELRTLPFLVSTESQKNPSEVITVVQRGMILWLLDLDTILDEFSEHWKNPASLQAILEELRSHKDELSRLRTKAFTVSAEETELGFWNAMRILDKLATKQIFTKHVLLIDEIDKLDDDELGFFFSRNQKLFERLYSEHNFVCFFSGQRSWADRIHSGTEYTYYHGQLLGAKPLVETREVQRLVVAQLSGPPLYMRQPDIPWEEEGYSELRRITGGIPRRIINRVSEVMNYSSQQKTDHIDDKIVKDAVSRGQYQKISKYLSDHFELYQRLKRSCADGSFPLMPEIYRAYSHRVHIDLDNDTAARTREIGSELDDQEWKRKISYLIRNSFLSTVNDYRVLDSESCSFFNYLDKLEVSYSSVPDILKELLVQPSVITNTEPDYYSALDRVFQIKIGWVTEQEAFETFVDTADVNNYFVSKYSSEATKEARRKFDEIFSSFLLRRADLLALGSEFRKIGSTEDSGPIQLLVELTNDKNLVDKFLTISTFKEINQFDTEELSNFVDDLLKFLANRKKVHIMAIEVKNEKTRSELFDVLQLPQDTRNRIQFFLSESIKASKPSLLKELLAAIVEDICKIAEEPPEIQIYPETPYSNLIKVRGLFRSLSGEVSTLDRDLDDKGFQFLFSIDPSKVSSLRILTFSRVGKDFSKEAKAFSSEFMQKGVRVEIRSSEELPNDAHARYLIDNSKAMKIPPLNIITRKLEEILPHDRRTCIRYFEKYWELARVVSFA